MPVSAYIYVLAVCLVVSLTAYARHAKGPRYLRLFSPFLLVALSIELLTAYMASKGKNNVTILNFFTVFEICFYLFLLSCILANARVKKIIRVAIPLYACAALANIFLYQGTKTIHTITYSLGCLLVVSCCIYFFLELFILPRPGRLWRNPAFWICTALLLFYCCSMPLIGLINYWMSISKFLIRNFALIVNILHVFLYALFTIAFLCQLKIRKYTLSRS